jgi:uncharacterized LabA/DUF88 family protein
MSFQTAPYTGPKATSYLFIDGGYLRRVFENFGMQVFGTKDIPVDYENLSRGYTKTFYYDCLPTKSANETEQQFEARLAVALAHHASLRGLRGWHVFEGVMKGTGKKLRQKEVDILIAVDMLTHTHRRNMHTMAFIAGDQDFRPLVEAVVREGMFIELWYEQVSGAADLLNAADARRHLGDYSLFHFTTKAFQKQYPFPHRVGQLEKSKEHKQLLATSQTADGQVAELYSQESGYLIIQPDPKNEGYFTHIRHADEAFLKLVHSRSDGTTEWNPVFR